jgi:signal transduction histidine kinase
MLHEFLAHNQAELIGRCRSKVAERPASQATDAQLAHGVPKFLYQIIDTLKVEQTLEPMRSRKVSGPAGGGKPVLSQIGETAAQHGRELLQYGFTVDQVVHDYGDLCQAITDLASERGATFEVDEFRTLNRCLDNAIADAVTEFTYQRDLLVEDNAAHAFNERLGVFAHELRDLLHTATLAVSAIKAGNVGIAGATGAVLDRSLIGLRALIDRSLAEVRVTAGLPARQQRLSLAEFIAEAKVAGALEAGARGCAFTVSAVDKELAIDVDRDLLLSAVGNLLQNAFKFTGAHTEVSLSAYASSDRILIDVEDHCGGLQPGGAEKMFEPFAQTGSDRSGLGLGLSICLRSVQENNGRLSVRNVPGSGCRFTIDLPRHAISGAEAAAARFPPSPPNSIRTRGLQVPGDP